jgi:hypothetical protein
MSAVAEALPPQSGIDGNGVDVQLVEDESSRRRMPRPAGPEAAARRRERRSDWLSSRASISRVQGLWNERGLERRHLVEVLVAAARCSITTRFQSFVAPTVRVCFSGARASSASGRRM